MKKLMTLSAVMLFLMSMIAFAQTTSVDMDLSGDQEVPPVDTAATGEVTATLDEGDNTLRVEGSFEDLESDLHNVSGSSAHIHMADAGETGPIIFNVEVETDDARSGSFDQTYNLTASQIDDFLDGLLYINVHSTDYPNGEILGQLAENVEINGTNTTNTTIPDTTTNQTNTSTNQTNTTTTTTTTNTTNTTGVNVDLNIHRWYPKGPDYVFMCDSTGFDLDNARYTWFYGDAHKLLDILNQNTYHVYTALGTYTVSCTVDDGVRTGTDSIVVNVNDLTRPINPLFGTITTTTTTNTTTNGTNTTTNGSRTFSCTADDNSQDADCVCTNDNGTTSCTCRTDGSSSTSVFNIFNQIFNRNENTNTNTNQNTNQNTNTNDNTNNTNYTSVGTGTNTTVNGTNTSSA